MNASALTVSKPAQSISQISEIRVCMYCGLPFTVNAQWSRQIYHDPDKERRLAMLRKQALVEWLAETFWRRHCWSSDMRAVARRCVEAEPEAMLRALAALGLCYDGKRKVWGRG